MRKKKNVINDKLVCDTHKRIYFNETDAGQVVYYGNMCKYMEIGSAEWFRKFAIPLSECHKKYNLFFVMKEIAVNYNKSLHYDDEIIIRTSVVDVKFTSIKFYTEIIVNGEVCYYGENKMIPISLESKKVQKIPDEILKLFKEVI